MQIYKAKANCFHSSSISISVEDRFCFICECEINNSFQFLGKCNREKLEIEAEVKCPEKISPSVNALINVSILIYLILILIIFGSKSGTSPDVENLISWTES